MKLHPVLLVSALACLTACADLEHSRNPADPAVAASTLAAQVCSNCHGLDGNSVSPAYPRLAGQTSAYLVQQLEHFRSHGRSDPAGSEYMWGISAHLTDAQIAGLAEYYAGQTPRRSSAAGRAPALVAAGREIFQKGQPDRGIMPCATCHGEQALGNAAFPRLALQHADYVGKQLAIFQDTHGGRPGTPMEAVTQPLNPAAAEAVAAYLEAMPD